MATQIREQEHHQQRCPDLTADWQLGQISGSDRIVLKSRDGKRQVLFSPIEGFALRYFTGTFTVERVQRICNDQFGDDVAPDCVANLVHTLVAKHILDADHSSSLASSTSILKPSTQWIEHPAGYWILRNPEDVTFLQVSHRDKQAIDQFGQLPPHEIGQRLGISVSELQGLLHLLNSTGMLLGSTPAKPPKRQRFSPLQLLFFRLPLFNPDGWLERHVAKLQWIWTSQVAFLLAFLLSAAALVGMNVSPAIVLSGQKLWATQGAIVLLPFILLCGLVVALHELGHAFTLKHYGGKVPEIGLLIMCLMPGCYTNTTDAYCLVKRRQRLLVVGAGILCQVSLWAFALGLWLLLTPGTWLKTGSYLFMAAALFTLAVNLNPLAKFDGYYLAVAATGINNLRSRSFLFYLNLVRGQPIREPHRDRGMLALYAPFSLLYTCLVFGHLLLWLLEWSLTHIPALALALLLAWLIYRYFPRSLPKGSTMTSASPRPTQSSPRPDLKVVSPPPSPTSPTSPTSPAPSDSPSPAFPKRLAIAGAISLSLVGIGLIPLPDTVTGDATIHSTPKQRQVVTLPEPAIIRTLYVQQNDTVRVGQLLAELASPDLNQQLIEIDRKLAEAQAERATAQQQLNLARSKHSGIRTRANHQSARATRLHQELGQLNSGQAPPQIRQLQSEQTEKASQIQGLQGQLAIVEAQIARYQELVTAGAMPLAQLNDLQRQQISLTSQINTLQAQTQTLTEQIATTGKTLQEEWSERQLPEVDEALSSLDAIQQEIGVATALVQKWEYQLPLLEQQKQKLLERQDRLTLRANVAGVIITPDLDVMHGQRMAEGKEILTIAGVSEPTAIVELSQSDASRIKVGMPVTFRLQDGDLQGFNAIVQDIPPIMAPENPQQVQQKAMVKVRVRFVGTPPAFTFGTQGYAHVQIGQLRLYQKVQRELLKLFPVGKFW
jgi:multidrug efflux pump subunit AcrA (membrane-fusion protein)